MVLSQHRLQCPRPFSAFVPSEKRNQLYLNFEVFNLADTWSARGYTSSQAYTETKSILTPAPRDLYVTAARRKQISGRFVF